MLFQHLYHSLFQSSLPLPLVSHLHSTTDAPKDSTAIRAWVNTMTQYLDTTAARHATHMAEHAPFVTKLNKKLQKLQLYDREKLIVVLDELHTVYSAMAHKKSQAIKAQEFSTLRAGYTAKGTPLLDNWESIRQFLHANADNVLAECPVFATEGDEKSQMLAATGYAVFETVLLQYDNKDIFHYGMDTQRVLDFYCNFTFPITTQDVDAQLILQNITEFKIYMASYAEIMDMLFAKFHGKEYIYAHSINLVSYFLDVIGYAYARGYSVLLAEKKLEHILLLPHFTEFFAFHFFNFMANIEHMRIAIQAFLNADTMKMLGSMVGQYNILERHQERHKHMDTQKQKYMDSIEKLWLKHHHIQDHVQMLAFLEKTQSTKIQGWLKLFGKKNTRDMVITVLTKYNAVCGMPHFQKRKIS